ncbi:MAG TPA: hypothetical protein VFX59_14125 [Polyangiales bacterium]|nr:hypothetical protein [Polyangiales bacterium]
MQRWQHSAWMVAAALMCGACAADTGTEEELGEQTEEETVSGLSLALTSVDTQGRAYRLRQATFTISDNAYWYYDGGVSTNPPTVLSTESDPDADRLTVRLIPGSYQVALGGDWYLERLGPNGPERVAQAVLLDEPVQYAYVGDGWNYDLDFRFGVDGSLIDFRHGDLNIDISIELPGEGPGYPQYDGGIVYPRDASIGVALDAGTITR